MGSTAGGIAFTLLPFLVMIFLYLIFVVIGFFVLYLVVRAAINNSKLNQNIEQLRHEISRMNAEIKTAQRSSINSED